ncbi:hypothetical protein LS71_007410 [Helicobacter jaachi]|uniref:TonB-dependent receptor n=1 Tax=Helicobacter jaachi TaxID=1677920 RepID=A0A4U8T8X8_9HELI|nr:TonB-dependent receptor [Helicobacter jaachi]TLD96063.1 hypothetical protein LS71_007410 [Helicobacter jaachi]
MSKLMGGGAERKEVDTKVAKSVNLGTSIVSDTKTQREIFYENDNISSINGEALEKLRITNSKDLASVFSGLYISSEGSDSVPQISLRGLNTGYFYNPSVRLYIDGVPQDIFFISQELLDVDSVELFKGMSGTLFGENAQAGVLSINSNMATNTPRARATFTMGQLDRSISGSASGAIVQDKLYAKVSFKHADYLGQIKDLSTNKLADTQDVNLARVSLLYDDGKWFLGADYYLDKSTLHDLIYLTDNERNDKNNIVHNFGTSPIPTLNRTIQTAAIKGGYYTDNFNIKNVFSVQDRALSVNNNNFIIDQNQRSFANELKATQTYENGSSSLYGAYISYNDYIHNHIKHANRQNDKNNLSTLNAALFTDHKIALPAHFDVGLGLRYSYYKSFIDYTQGNSAIPSFADNTDKHQLSPRITLSYTLADAHKLYTSAARDFKAGGFPNVINNQAFLRYYKPEYTYTTEFGYKGLFWQDRIYINADYFYIYAQNRQEYMMIDETTSIIGNMGDMVSHGFELESKFQFLRDSFFMLNFAYINADYKKATNPFTGEVLDSQRVFYTPKFNLNASLDMILWRNSVANLYFNTLVSHKSQVWFSTTGTTLEFSQKPYTLWDLGLRAEFSNNLSLAFKAENVLNTLYDTYGYNRPAEGGNQHRIGRLRNYSLTLSYRF